MAINRTELQDKLIKAYSTYYDIERCPDEATGLTASAVFHEHGSSYVVSQKAELWSADRHEYVFIYSIPDLTAETFQVCLEQCRRLGEPLIKPEPGHMSSSLVLMILCDHAEPEAAALLQKFKYRKNFRFSLHGWMDIQTAALVTSDETILGNRAAKNTTVFLSEMLHPRKKRSKINLFH